MIRPVPTIFMISLAGLLAGCNFRDSLYSQGPWGLNDAQRRYPQYPSPWNRPDPYINGVFVSGAKHSMGLSSAQSDARSLTEVRSYQRVVGLPLDPQPSSHPEMVVSIAPPIPEQVVAMNNPQPQAPGQVTASAESPPSLFSAPRRASSYSGTWKAKDHKGESCLIHLSSVASIDLYKASVSRCSNGSLREVNAWSFHESRIVLYSRGVEVAQLTGSEAALSGALSKAGTSLEMSR